MQSVTVVGAGLAGCEAALQCARRGVPVRLFEMRPAKMTEAHATGDVAELVCSNSLKSEEPENAHGLLKAELRVLGSVLLECAERARVPGGKALVVDRRRFSAEVQRALDSAGVEVTRQEVTGLPAAIVPSAARSAESRNLPGETPRIAALPRGDREEGVISSETFGAETSAVGDTIRSPGRISVMSPDETSPLAALGRGDVMIIATGPLTSQAMAESLQELLGADRLFFYDAIAPIVSAESLDMTRVFEGSRYGAGSDYLNCPMTEEEYDRFVAALVEAEVHPVHEFEERAENRGQSPGGARRTCGFASAGVSAGTVPVFGPQLFEGCLPVEEIARRGRLALAFGPMKPVGLADPRTGTRPFAVVQLRPENTEGTMYNLVGFQSRLKLGEQERVFRMIPGLAKAAFQRYGSIHRNTYLDSPKVLLPTLQTRPRPDLLVAGQLTGVEGYVESIGAGLVAGINAARLAEGDEPVELPRETMLGSLLRYITSPCDDFQPMNANFGLPPPLEKRLRGRDKRRALAERALAAARGFALTVAENRA